MPEAIYSNISRTQLGLQREEKNDKEWQYFVDLMDKSKTPKEARPSYRLYKQSRDSFNPDGAGYDYYTALKEGLTPFLGDDGYYHWGSRAPVSQQFLKGLKHPTAQLAIEEDARLGYYVGQSSRDGRFYSQLVN